MAHNLDLARKIRAAAYEQMTVLDADDLAHPWADGDLQEAYRAKRFIPGAVSFLAFPEGVVCLHIQDAGYPAIDALDFAAQLDNSDGWIEIMPDNRMAIYWLAG